MVFLKKEATALQNVQPKKKGKKQVEAEDDSDMFNDTDDSDDFGDDSDDDMLVQKTPQNKTPKGRQSLSEKKVTFDMSGKNTPGKKTPNKNDSLVMKKTPTPDRGEGQAGDSDDSDDEDYDDSGDSIDLDLEIDSDEGDDDEDEEEEDDEDEEEEDEEEEDDGDEEEEQKPNQNQASKQKNNVEQNKQKTPIKNENAKNKSPEAKMPKSEPVSPKMEQGSPQKNASTQSSEMKRKERDAKTLFVGGLPLDATTEELKSLSPDITNVMLPKYHKNAEKLFAFLWFNSEAEAEANYKTLQNKEIRGQPLNIDFAGEKSKKNLPNIDEKKLYVRGLPVDATIYDLAVHFPKAYEISFSTSKSSSFRTAFMKFESIEDANEALTAKNEVEVLGSKLTIVHTVSTLNKKNESWPQKNKENNAKQGGNAAKKMKFTQKEESSDEE